MTDLLTVLTCRGKHENLQPSSLISSRSQIWTLNFLHDALNHTRSKSTLTPFWHHFTANTSFLLLEHLSKWRIFNCYLLVLLSSLLPLCKKEEVRFITSFQCEWQQYLGSIWSLIKNLVSCQSVPPVSDVMDMRQFDWSHTVCINAAPEDKGKSLTFCQFL